MTQHSDRRERLVRDALAELGVRRLVFAIHDVSFPSDADEDVGRGSPGTRAAARLLAFLRRLGFSAVQLGPQGQTARDNPSPYDGTIFSRNVASIPLSLFDDARFRGLVADASRARAIRGAPRDEALGARAGARADHARAHDTLHGLAREAYTSFAKTRPRPLADALDEFERVHRPWLERDALYAAIAATHGGAGYRDWGHDLDLWAPGPSGTDAAASRRQTLAAAHREAVERYAFGQLLAHEAHARFRSTAAALGLALYADLQVGFSDSDAWTLRGLMLRDYAMGAPPSRTTPAGQPWSYAVFDPHLYYEDGSDQPDAAHGPVLRFMRARADKALAEYDSVRIDHPHGFVCPWVYRTDTGDAARAVRDGARLFESPDLDDHPALRAFARVRPDQIDRAKPRYADDWVAALEPDQITRYAATMRVVVDAAVRHGRDPSGIACEVLSTMPRPLGSVLERLGLGRFRVAQKANLDDPRDVYRSENAAPRDWIMLGNHDTPTIWALVRGFSDAMREKWARHLATRLAAMGGRAPETEAMARDPGLLAHAMLAELFVSRAENVSVFFADLFGYEDRYNEPGAVGPNNWSLRLPPDFERSYGERAARREALDLAFALSIALEALGPPSDARRALADALRAT